MIPFNPRRLAALPVLLLWLCLALVPSTTALKGDSACTTRPPHLHFCINATIENDLATYQLTNLLSPPEEIGWMAIGFGQTMLQSPLVILWKNADGSMSISQRTAIWYMEPRVVKDPAQVATAVNPKSDAWIPAKATTFAFQIPVNKTRLANSPVENLVWAFSPVRPGSDSPHASLARHTEVGYAKLDLSKDTAGSEPKIPTPKPGSPSSPKTPDPKNPSTKPPSQPHGKGSTHGKTVLAHAFLLTFGFLIVLPTGVLTGRWARTFTPIWFKVHWILNWPVALPMIAFGWMLGPIAVNQHDGPHFSDPHKIWGTIIVSIYLVQILLGRHIHKKRAEKTPPIKVNHPPLNILHVVVGLLLLVLAFMQVKSGLDKLVRNPDYENLANWGHKLWNFWAVAVPFGYVIGLYFVPKQFNQERANATGAAPQGGYVQLSEGAPSPSTRLLSESTNNDRDPEDRLR